MSLQICHGVCSQQFQKVPGARESSTVILDVTWERGEEGKSIVYIYSARATLKFVRSICVLNSTMEWKWANMLWKWILKADDTMVFIVSSCQFATVNCSENQQNLKSSSPKRQLFLNIAALGDAVTIFIKAKSIFISSKTFRSDFFLLNCTLIK